MKVIRPPLSLAAVLSALLAALALAGCASIPENDQFLAKNVEPRLKAAAAVAQGAEKYAAYLERDADYSKVAEIRKYFEVALTFDPANEEAEEYIAKLDGFSKSFVSSRLATAEKILAKGPKDEAEEYAVVAALQSAQAADPNNEKINKLLKEQKGTKDKLFALYLERSLAASAKAGAAPPAKADDKAKGADKTKAAADKTKAGDKAKGDDKTKAAAATPAPVVVLSAAEREAAWVEAYVNAAKAVAVDPANGQAAKAKAAALAEIEKTAQGRAAMVKSRIGASKFEDAKAELAKLSALDKTVGGAFAKTGRELTYQLNLAWAKSLEAKKDFAGARDKADAAIAIDRTDEALALRKRAVASMSSIEGEASFDAALAELDKLIAKGDVPGAWKRADAVAKSVAKDAARKAKVDERRAKIRAGIKPYYERGVAAYRAEDYKTAISELGVVVAIDSAYEQAADYLDKAKEKQKLIDQFNN